MTCEIEGATKKVARQYFRDMLGACLAYVGVLVVSVFVVRRMDPPQWVAIGLALASAAPALLMLRAFLRRLQGLDEFQRRVELEALAVAAAVVGLGSFTYGFLQSFANFPQIDDVLLWVFPALCFTWGIAQFFVRRRYK
ncbi:MAG: hypothetical protein R3C27_16010 [Hyphomonadaceae bacterium]